MAIRIESSLREIRPFLIDALRIVDCSIIALLLYGLTLWHIGQWFEHYNDLALTAFILSLPVFHYTGLYKPWRGKDYLSDVKAIVLGWLFILTSLLLFLFIFKMAGRYSRLVLISWFLATPLALFLLHAAVLKVLRIFRMRGINIKRSVIVGAGPIGIRLANYIQEIPWTGVKVLGFFDDQDVNSPPGTVAPLLGRTDGLLDYIKKNSVHSIYIALPMREELKIREILRTCRMHGAKIYFLPDLESFKYLNGRVKFVGELMLVDFNPDSDVKDFFDVAFSLFVILVTLPLSLVIAMVIKLQDGGPVFYRQRRITVTGREFYCIKFRSMRVDADHQLERLLQSDPEARREWQGTFKLKNDPRITFAGRFLRKTSLDELPQFLNVLRGEMSVVGARPIVERELYEYYKDNGGIYCSIKPGITGMWQVGKRSDTEDYQERVKLDVWYAVNRNFWIDLKIIFLTIGCMVKSRGAY